jgi:hypothetical protein
MSGIKFWKGDENLRPVNKKTRLTRYWVVACILDFLVHRKYGTTLTLFFFEYVEWGIKKSYFCTYLKNVHLTWVKSAPEIFFQKTGTIFLLAKQFLFFGAFSFLKSVWKDGFFYTPIAKFDEKKFSSLRRDNEHFLRNWRSKMKKPPNISKTFFRS